MAEQHKSEIGCQEESALLELIRRNARGWVVGFLSALLALTFALWGAQNYRAHGRGSEWVLKVNGQAASQSEFDGLYRVLLARGGQKQVAAVHSPYALSEKQSRVYQQAMQMLESRLLVVQWVKQQHFEVPPLLVKAALQSFAAFKAQDGHFSSRRFQDVMRHVGQTPSHFLSDLSADIMRSQLQLGLLHSEFASPSPLSAYVSTVLTLRDIRVAVVDAHAFAATVPVALDEKQLRRAYQEEKAALVLPEQVQLDYVLFSPVAMKKTHLKSASEAQLRAFYAQNSRRYSGRPFSSVKEAVRAAWETKQWQQVWSDLLERITELAYTEPDTLQPLVNVGGVRLRTPYFSRKGAGLPQGDPLTAPGLLQQAFSPSLLLEKNNSTPITLPNGDVLVARVAVHRPARTRDFEEAKPILIARLRARRAYAAMQSKAEVWQKKGRWTPRVLPLQWKTYTGVLLPFHAHLLSHLSSHSQDTKLMVSMRKNAHITLNPKVIEAAFRLPVPSASSVRDAQKAQRIRVPLSEGKMALVTVLAEHRLSVSEQARAQLKQMLSHLLSAAYASQMQRAIVSSVRQHAKIHYRDDAKPLPQ